MKKKNPFLIEYSFDTYISHDCQDNPDDSHCMVCLDMRKLALQEGRVRIAMKELDKIYKEYK